jgi:secondary thiamine-phosphate synthase enzyme
METEVISFATGGSRGVFDITREAARFVALRGSGLLNVFAPHATAGIAIIETGAGSDADLMDRLDAMLPRDDDLYRHRHGSKGHGADHVLPGIVAPSVTVPVVDGVLALGTWQSIVFVDPNADNPQRNVRLTFIAG